MPIDVVVIATCGVTQSPITSNVTYSRQRQSVNNTNNYKSCDNNNNDEITTPISTTTGIPSTSTLSFTQEFTPDSRETKTTLFTDISQSNSPTIQDTTIGLYNIFLTCHYHLSFSLHAFV